MSSLSKPSQTILTLRFQDFVSVIKLMFARLSVLATTYGHPYPIDVPPESVIIGQRTVFASMRDARTALFDLMADSHAFIRDANAWKESLVLKRTMDSNSVNDSSNGYHRISLLNEVSHVNVGVGLKTVRSNLFVFLIALTLILTRKHLPGPKSVV